VFELGVFADDIDQNLDHALDVIQELGVKWVEIRSAWGKNLVFHADEQLEQIAQAIHARGLRVPCLAAPIFKSRLKGRGQASAQLFHAEERDDPTQQIELLRKAARIARLLGTHRVRCFSFWRISDDPTPIWADLLEQFEPAIKVAEKEDIILVVENDFECNLGDGEHTARFIQEVGSPHLRLLWDPGNAYFVGETAYPSGYEHGKHLIGHVHVKDAVRDPVTGKPSWVTLGTGEVDLLGQLRALKADGYEGVVTMENHFTPPNGSQEDGVRRSFAGLQRLLAEVE
jgi:sugar phosphate isomerase/epimerase